MTEEVKSALPCAMKIQGNLCVDAHAYVIVHK